MTLPELLALSPDLEVLRTVGLVFSAELANRLLTIQQEYGDPRHVPSPRQLTDGRWCLPGDILSEVQQGGLVHAGFSHLDASRFDEIAVLPIADVIDLLPAQPSTL